MEINFYEEFPIKKNLEKIKLIKFKTKVFVLAKSHKHFIKLKNTLSKMNKKAEMAYWPLVKNSYYISPFSNTKDLKNLFKRLDKTREDLLIDIELPKKRLMLLKNFFVFQENKRIIKNFLEQNKRRITTPQIPFFSKVMILMGFDYDIDYEKNPMFYTSMMPPMITRIIKKRLLKIKEKKKYSIGIGVIAHGILGNEPLLSPKRLQEDLKFVKGAGFKKVVIFRLGGLNKRYVKVINKFQKNS